MLAQKNGRCKTSEKRLLQSTLGSLEDAWSRHVERHVLRHEKDSGCDLHAVQPTTEQGI